MVKGYLIAFGKKPLPGFLDTLREISVRPPHPVEIKGALLVPGPGCWNLAILIEEDTEFVNALTVALMPAKWEETSDPRLQEGQFITEGESA